MVATVENCVSETTTEGTGTLTLGSAPLGLPYFSLQDVVSAGWLADGQEADYAVHADDLKNPTKVEYGTGTIGGAGTTLTRGAYRSYDGQSFGTTALSLPTGTHYVLLVPSARNLPLVAPLAHLTGAEAQQLLNIEDTVISAAQWGLLGAMGAEAGRLRRIRRITASSFYSKPAWLRLAVVRVWGAGGGGAIGYGTAGASGSGGGGGFAERVILASEMAATETVTVGARGLGGIGSMTFGTQGGSSSFGVFCSATGGGGGAYTGAAGATGGGGGAGSPGGAGFAFADTRHGSRGLNGGEGISMGGSAPLGGQGGLGAYGGSTAYGGSAGVTPGGGGGTGFTFGGGGGAGGSGLVIVYEYE